MAKELKEAHVVDVSTLGVSDKKTDNLTGNTGANSAKNSDAKFQYDILQNPSPSIYAPFPDNTNKPENQMPSHSYDTFPESTNKAENPKNVELSNSDPNTMQESNTSKAQQLTKEEASTSLSFSPTTPQLQKITEKDIIKGWDSIDCNNKSELLCKAKYYQVKIGNATLQLVVSSNIFITMAGVGNNLKLLDAISQPIHQKKPDSVRCTIYLNASTLQLEFDAKSMGFDVLTDVLESIQKNLMCNISEDITSEIKAYYSQYSWQADQKEPTATQNSESFLPFVPGLPSYSRQVDSRFDQGSTTASASTSTKDYELKAKREIQVNRHRLPFGAPGFFDQGSTTASASTSTEEVSSKPTFSSQ